MKNFLLLVLFFPILIFSQEKMNGVLVDVNSNRPLPFATLTTNTNFVLLTDIDGKFSLELTPSINTLKVSYVGYKSKIIPVSTSFLKIKLEHSTEQLNEIVITATENPALRIIRNTIANKSKNNIEKGLKSFIFNTYNKTLVTANPDSISGKLDTIFTISKGEKQFKKIDSTNFKFKKEINKQHLYISEKVSEFQFENGKKTKEIILGSRMAGLQQPIYEILALTIQDFSFYNEFYTVAGTKYINPIADNALDKYNYTILDTITKNNKTSILIHYKPKEIRGFIGIEGVLYIDSKSYAITKGIAELKGIVRIKSEQNFEFNSTCNCWFPQDAEITIKKGANDKSVKLFGGMVQFNTDKKQDSISNTSKNSPSDIIYFISSNTNSNIQINPEIKIKKSSATMEFNDDAGKKTTEFWNIYRTDSITFRGENTYKKLDSIAKKENIEKKINIARSLLQGFYPTKYFNLNLGKILNLNNYEGFRLGFGGVTNQNFSSKYKLESYIAYGTKDTNIKYSVGASTRLNKDTNTWIGSNYTNDIKEAASLNFIAENTSFSPINPRNLNIDKFYKYRTASLFLEHDIQPNLEGKIQISSGDYRPVFDYLYTPNGNSFYYYTLSTATVNIQYSPKNEYLNSPIGKIKTKTDFPQFTFQFTKSFKNVLDGDFNFSQLNLRILHKIKPLRKGSTSVLLESGLVLGDAPISHLFNATPNYTFKNPWSRRVTFAGKMSFETMGYNEFISDKFIALHLKQNFEPFKLGKSFKPQISIATRAAIGSIKNPEYHVGLDFRGMEKGYFESGMEINSLLKGIGFSAFYRYGAYENPIWSDNLAVKLTYKLSLGF